MCTVVFLPNNGQYFFASLRDENPLRQAANAPAIYTKYGVNYLAPLDAKAGGTWVGTNEFGNVIILLNGGFENHIRQASYRKSRGLIVKELLAVAEPVSDWLSMDLNNIEPFTLIVFSDNHLYQLVWDGHLKHHIGLDVSQPYIWSSATLYNKAAKATRSQLFKQWLVLHPKISQQSILSFFESVDDIDNGFLINRSVTMQTLSYTFIALSEFVDLQYHDFLNATKSTTSLALKASRRSILFMISKDAIFKLKSFYIKLCSWEYWPMWVVYFPLGFYYTYLAIKARSFFFFSASNPSIETGGMFFESKWSIFQLMPKHYFPSTILVEQDDALPIVEARMIAANIEFPVIAKPDRGERGWCVKKINSFAELVQYKTNTNIPFLVQSYIDYPVELSVFYYRHPKSKKGIITSVTYKKLLSVVGDGVSNIGTLIKKSDRAFLQYQRLEKENNIDFNMVLPLDEEKVLVPYGNHVLGTMFIDFNYIIDDALTNAIDAISKNIEGFYFGRFDLRCASIEDLKMQRNFSILELNGAGAEPAHIYHPGFSFFKAQKVLMQHFKMLFDASKANEQQGVPFMSYQAYKHTKQLEKAFKQQALQA